MIELLDIGVSRPRGGWRIRGISAALNRGEVTLLLAGTPDERRAIVDVVSAHVIPTEGRAWVTGIAVTRLTAPRIGRRLAVIDVPSTVGASWIESGGQAPGPFGFTSDHERQAWHAELSCARQALGRVGLMGRMGECISVTDRSARVRLEVARALMGAPDYLVLAEVDERLEADDAVNLLHTLHALARADRVGVLVTAANPVLARQFVDRVLVLANGTLLSDGPAPGPLAA